VTTAGASAPAKKANFHSYNVLVHCNGSFSLMLSEMGTERSSHFYFKPFRFRKKAKKKEPFSQLFSTPY
jgi:hypothetical protein